MSKVEKGRARSLWSGDPPQNIFENLNSRNAIFPTSDGVDGSSSLNQSPTLEESVNEVLANNVLMDLLCSWLWELSGSRIALAPGPGPQAKQRIVRQFDLPAVSPEIRPIMQIWFWRSWSRDDDLRTTVMCSEATPSTRLGFATLIYALFHVFGACSYRSSRI